MKTSFWKAGHPPTLFAAFLYFDLAFMVWVVLGPLGVQIAKDLALTPAQKGLMVATPVLAGALLRIVMGILVDHLKPKMAGAIGQIIVIAALAFAWIVGVKSYDQVLLLGIFLGVAGASRCRWLRAGIRRSIKARRWVLPVRATRARCSLHCSRLLSRRPTAGRTCSVLR